MEKEVIDQLAYLRGQVAGLAVHVADALAGSPKTSARLQEYSDQVITGKTGELSHAWINGFRDAIALVGTHLDN